MKKIILMALPVSLIGCSALDEDSNFSDSVNRVESKQNYQLVVGKTLTPKVVNIKGGQLVQSSLEFNYVAPLDASPVPDSFVTLELQYFKNYEQFDTVVFEDNTTAPISPYAAPAETCGDICVSRQYIQFPVDDALFKHSDVKDLEFDLVGAKNAIFTFMIPAGYIEAITSSGNRNLTTAPTALIAVSQEPATKPSLVTKSKPQEMALYWYEQMDFQQQEAVVNWAVKNRRATDLEFKTTEQAQKMFAYWFNQASEAERKAITIELISK
ncbi:DUF2057 domain-containing protein [Vibrio sp. JPW-9-11-11]|uniref:DUF2057 domain-containing protein n=1 Tax=Vibrio sp. JPW-9-11-11 TaxID=1416532 RepID=UPI001594997F|nr:DUF2057 domain-containing protein [Vibrio sp. JPW-9-11-11]